MEQTSWFRRTFIKAGRTGGRRRRRDVADGLIATTAKVHDLNVADFDDADVSIVNPWALD